MVNYTNYILIKSPGIAALESLSYGLLVLDTYFFFLGASLLLAAAKPSSKKP